MVVVMCRGVGTRLACLQSRPVAILNCVMQNTGPQTVKQLKLYIKQEWERILPTKLQQLGSSDPKHLFNVVRRKGNVTQR